MLDIILLLIVLCLIPLYVIVSEIEEGHNHDKPETSTDALRVSSAWNGFVDCSKVRVLPSSIPGANNGVFADVPIREGEIIEVGIMTPLCDVPDNIGHSNPHLFTWSDDRKTWAMGSGCLPFYNHSETPNCLKKGDLTRNTMTVVALRDIAPGEEIFSRYYSKGWRECFQSF